jgi:hypothetical protein
MIQARNKNGKHSWLIDGVILTFGTSLTSIAEFTKAYGTSVNSRETLANRYAAKVAGYREGVQSIDRYMEREGFPSSEGVIAKIQKTKEGSLPGVLYSEGTGVGKIRREQAAEREKETLNIHKMRSRLGLQSWM